jgi:hypothetical protein
MIDPIEGYAIVLIYRKPDLHRQVGHFPLKVGKTGGAHIKNPESLITLIEDAIFMNEQKEKAESTEK